MTTCISNLDAVIDSRDVIARIEELEAERESLAEAYEEAKEANITCDNEEDEQDTIEARDEAAANLAEWNVSEDAEEFRVLKALADEASASPDWTYGETLIRESYFQDYAEQLADDCGMVPNDLRWPCTCIDWAQAARELAYNYFHVEFNGVTYLIRS